MCINARLGGGQAGLAFPTKILTFFVPSCILPEETSLKYNRYLLTYVGQPYKSGVYVPVDLVCLYTKIV